MATSHSNSAAHPGTPAESLSSRKVSALSAPAAGPKTEKAGLVFTPVRVSSAGRVLPGRWVPASESKSAASAPSPGAQLLTGAGSLARAESPAKRSLGASAGPALWYDLTGFEDLGGYPEDWETTSSESEYPAAVSATHSDQVNVGTPSALDQVSGATPGTHALPGAQDRAGTTATAVSGPQSTAGGQPAAFCHPTSSTTPSAEESFRKAAAEDDMTNDLSDNSDEESEPSPLAVLLSKVAPTQEI
ncbi:hypothetical protein PtA15_4A332 [Puccinia triticina]|uniref:Uncharacterized protein n=1 Tax=Puccinia triticina TaxID=208348 RepID=A0ABY7CG53_9BASI|nr:uncharacterized protein PtA15_4A332 [Puccinia triticina]WAQ83883.1 hypothetical protein PtA15_4A332 [Puccinia triticina]